MRTIASRQVRELERKLPEHTLSYYHSEFEKYWKVISQQRFDKDKIYSLHKPFTKCISKGKAHKEYEFSNKVGRITGTTRGKKIVVTASPPFWKTHMTVMR